MGKLSYVIWKKLSSVVCQRVLLLEGLSCTTELGLVPFNLVLNCSMSCTYCSVSLIADFFPSKVGTASAQCFSALHSGCLWVSKVGHWTIKCKTVSLLVKQ